VKREAGRVGMTGGGSGELVRGGITGRSAPRGGRGGGIGAGEMTGGGASGRVGAGDVLGIAADGGMAGGGVGTWAEGRGGGTVGVGLGAGAAAGTGFDISGSSPAKVNFGLPDPLPFSGNFTSARWRAA
jgi:hypothetical protein